ncbi:hypothetical protein DL89DRAFT_270731 [Linderina pennispora]|uniref:Nudix hydrolase 3 n=1 Tax=Linderina pennispora TaxID=61395 RepID=A0A1Y1VXC5_9FUNG|nr:uncharacterized protein DL89DRAFT_270731 [Linderina pennispora]ORX65675.1 hypothetical protein DL89DRAFT_270731 [Linderina pennispora]
MVTSNLSTASSSGLTLRADLSHLTEGDKRALVKLADPRRQKILATLFELFRGPWDRSLDNEVFVPGAAAKPITANVYPEDMDKKEFELWLGTLSEEDKARAKGFYDVVKRDKKYADEYPTRYLDSEVSWLKINHTSALEAAVGPYETYEDELFSSKAFFESMVHVRDFAATQLLDKFTSSLELVEKNLPIPDSYRNKELVAPPIVVVNQVYYGGDTAVPMTAAYNLPNDEEAIERAGSKLTMIKNVQEGKVASVLRPIAQEVLSKADLDYVTFPAFFTHVLMHEVAHSNGPHRDTSGATVRSRLQELHSAFEEAKADITGLFAARLLVDRGVVDDISMREFYTTYLASAFRSVRFGLAEAHGLGQAMQLSFLLEKGGFVYSAGKFAVDMEKIGAAVEELTHEIMMIQGNGDKERAVAFREKYGVLAPEVKQALENLKGVPIDIAPIWVDIENLRRQFS